MLSFSLKFSVILGIIRHKISNILDNFCSHVFQNMPVLPQSRSIVFKRTQKGQKWQVFSEQWFSQSCAKSWAWSECTNTKSMNNKQPLVKCWNSCKQVANTFFVPFIPVLKTPLIAAAAVASWASAEYVSICSQWPGIQRMGCVWTGILARHHSSQSAELCLGKRLPFSKQPRLWWSSSAATRWNVTWASGCCFEPEVAQLLIWVEFILIMYCAFKMHDCSGSVWAGKVFLQCSAEP